MVDEDPPKRKDAMDRSTLATLALMLATLPGTAHAESATQIAPPFDGAYTGEYGCALTSEGCASEATADEDGTLSLDVRVESLLNGRLPVPVRASAWTALTVEYDVPEITARRFLYTITLHIDQASATATAGVVGPPGHAWASAVAYAYHGDEGEGTSAALVDSDGVVAPSEASDREVTLSMTVGDGVSRTHGGRAYVSLEVEGWAGTGRRSTEPGGGSVSLAVALRAVSVTVDVIQ